MSKPDQNRFRPTHDDAALEETEAHARNYSDRNVKHDVDEVSWDDDTEGHRFSSSDAGVKHDVKDVAWEDEDGTEGHGVRIKV